MASTVTRQELAQVIGEKTLHTENTKKLARQIAAFLTEQTKPIDIDSLVRDVMQYRLEHGIVEAVAVSAHPLTPAVVADVKQLLKAHFPNAKTVRVDSRIDESLVGGIKLELPHEVLDLSVRSKLNTFKRLVAEERN